MRLQAEIYNETAAHYKKEAATIRQKATKLRTNTQIGPSDRAEKNSTQPSTS